MPDIDSKKASVKCTKISENRKGKDEKSPSKGQTKIVKIIITLVLKLYSLPREASSNATPENNPREDEKINEKATDISLYENEIKAGKNIAKEINNIDQPKENNKVEIICIKISLKKIKSYSKKFFYSFYHTFFCKQNNFIMDRYTCFTSRNNNFLISYNSSKSNTSW